jgi:hypothetical protein
METAPPRERFRELDQIGEEIVLVDPADDVPVRPDAPTDQLEAQDPSHAHQLSNRPSHITKPGNSRQPTIGHGNRHGGSATSWPESRTVEADQPAERPIPRKRRMVTPDEVSAAESEGRFTNIAERQ